MRPIRLVLCAAFVAACAARAQVGPLEDLASFPRGRLEIQTASATHRFDVWIADTPERQAQGLMFVRDLPPDRGMVFVHEPPRTSSMWMKNTYIELDMLFVARGRIVKIAQRTRPHSLATIAAEIPVSAVIEIRGGEVERRRLKQGDRVRFEKPQ
ncbi:MAG: DUF192 domain-containing protein [Gammaproteobacteria bacterium]